MVSLGRTVNTLIIYIYTLFEQVDAKSKVWSGYCAQLTNDSLMDRGR